MKGTILIAALALGACSTMSPQQCQVADWKSLGYQDGAAGRAISYYGRREKDCAEAGVRADLEAYNHGRFDGLRVYCTPASGWRAAMDGKSYEGVCPADLAPGFLSAYEPGRRAFLALSAFRDAESELSSLRSARDSLDRKVRDAEAALEAAAPAEKEAKRAELAKLREDRARKDGEIRGQESALRARSDELARARADIGFKWGSW